MIWIDIPKSHSADIPLMHVPSRTAKNWRQVGPWKMRWETGGHKNCFPILVFLLHVIGLVGSPSKIRTLQETHQSWVKLHGFQGPDLPIFSNSSIFFPWKIPWFFMVNPLLMVQSIDFSMIFTSFKPWSMVNPSFLAVPSCEKKDVHGEKALTLSMVRSTNSTRGPPMNHRIHLGKWIIT